MVVFVERVGGGRMGDVWRVCGAGEERGDVWGKGGGGNVWSREDGGMCGAGEEGGMCGSKEDGV